MLHLNLASYIYKERRGGGRGTPAPVMRQTEEQQSMGARKAESEDERRAAMASPLWVDWRRQAPLGGCLGAPVKGGNKWVFFKEIECG